MTGRKGSAASAMAPAQTGNEQEAAGWRSACLAILAASAASSPDLLLRWGAVACLAILASRLRSIRLDAVNLFAIALTLWAVLSQVWAIDRDVTSLAIQNHLAVLAIFLAVRTSITTARGLLLIAWGYLAGCIHATYLLFRQNPSVGFKAELSNARLTFEGVNINYLAYSLAVGVAVLVLLWVMSHRKGVRLLFLACAGIFCFAIWHSGTRGAVTSVVLLIGWLVVGRLNPGRTLAVSWIAIGVSAAAIASGAADALLRVVDRESSRSTGDLAGRLVIWPAAREVFGQNLFAGVGAGGFRAVSPLGIGGHDVILEIGTGLGIVGVALFLGTYISALASPTFRATARLSSFLVGSILLSSAPMYLSGHWELSPVGWLMLALYSRVAVLSAAKTPLTNLSSP